MGFDCPETKRLEVSRALAPLVLGMEAVQAAEEATGVNKRVDSRAASLHSSLAMRVDCLSIVLTRVGKAAKSSDIVCVVTGTE